MARAPTRRRRGLDWPAIAQRQTAHRPPPRPMASCVTMHQRGAARLAHGQQQVEDVAPVGGVEIPGWLVGEDQRRIVGQRARNGDALLLAARQLRRIVMPAIVQADLVEQRLRARARIAPARQSPSAPGCSRAPSATARDGRTERRSRSSRRAAARARPRRAP